MSDAAIAGDAPTLADAAPADAALPVDAALVDGSTVDAGAADASPTCTGQLYDACKPGNTSCLSNECHDFIGRGFAVCTRACSAQDPCPPQRGAPVACNNMGICVPSAPNSDCSAP
jgi:hypothetical protein